MIIDQSETRKNDTSIVNFGTQRYPQINGQVETHAALLLP